MIEWAHSRGVTIMQLVLLTAITLFQAPRIDALLSWRADKVYAFSGTNYYRYDLKTNAMDPGYPRPIAGNWQGLPFQTIDAAVNWQNGKAYLFSGGYYVRYDIATDRIDPGYPKPTRANWSLPWDQVDAALHWTGNVVYFFNRASRSYVRYQLNARAPDPGYPKPIAGNWNGQPFPDVDAATSYRNRGYFSRGASFSRFLIPSGQVEAGYPKALSWLPDVGSRGGTTRPPSPSPPTANATTCRINGTLAFKKADAYGRLQWQPWNNVRVELHRAGVNFNGRYQQLRGAGYTDANAMSQVLREDNLWQRIVNTTTKPAQLQSGTYGYSYSWFGFVGLKPGVYRVVVPGYPTLNRWVKFTAPNQKIEVKLEHP